uniref:Uncharacterized protein n=1 Tax=Glossina austeni TaxID=7395 RepID=A0A1A9UI08_GLOAU
MDLDERHSILIAGFNSLLTDSSPLDRAPPDLGRSSIVWQRITCFASCKTQSHHPTMSNASVVITYDNALKSVLLRSLYNLIERTPNYLLDEIILVGYFDDISFDIENYLANQLMHEAKVLHLKDRQGLIKVCIEGQVKVLVFLDAPIKAKPSLEPLKDNHESCTAPTVDIIT